MPRLSYTGNSIAPLVGTTFYCTWGDGKSEVSIQVNPKTRKPAYKVSTSYLNNVNQVGWFLKGKLDESTVDSRLRPAHLIDKETGKSLAELRKNPVKPAVNSKFTSIQKELSSKCINKAVNLSNLTDIQKIAVRQLLIKMKRDNTTVFSKEYVYGFLKERGLDFFQRKEVGKCLLADKVLNKVGENYTFGSIWEN